MRARLIAVSSEAHKFNDGDHQTENHEAGAQIHIRTLDYMNENGEQSYETAFVKVVQANPDLASRYRTRQ